MEPKKHVTDPVGKTREINRKFTVIGQYDLEKQVIRSSDGKENEAVSNEFSGTGKHMCRRKRRSTALVACYFSDPAVKL